jgi:hypothetical protein
MLNIILHWYIKNFNKLDNNISIYQYLFLNCKNGIV